MINLIASQLFIYIFFIPTVSSAADTITANQSLYGDQTIVSSDENFEMGFYRPGNSSNYYIGIWYKKVKETTISLFLYTIYWLFQDLS
ncbi:putative non-specific serine/threonine protein kinase [Helianthus annuus]|nr:putative non-specific serine/threonine protein kinase [Helianthus annuus]